MIDSDYILSHFDNVKSGMVENSYTCRCPSHGDRSNSLKITFAHDRVLFRCYAGCDFKSILDASGLKTCDCFETQENKERYDEIKVQRERIKQFIRDYREVNIASNLLENGYLLPVEKFNSAYLAQDRLLKSFPCDRDELYQDLMLEQGLEIAFRHYRKNGFKTQLLINRFLTDKT